MYRFIATILFGCVLYPSILSARLATEVVEKQTFVMILNSYSYEEEWSTALAKEICNRLQASGQDIKMNITYAGIAARTSFLADRFAMQGAFANGRLNNQIKFPDVLVLIGDESWMLYRVMNLRGIWERIPVVLCGVHAEVLKDYRQFFPDRVLPDSSFIPLAASNSMLKMTAVIEPDNAARTLQLAQTLVPDIQHLYYFSDGSYADSYMRRKLLQSCKERDVPFTEILFERNHADSVARVVAGLGEKSVVVTNGIPVPKDIRVPVLTLRDVLYQSRIPVGGYFAPVAAYADKTAEAVLHFLETDGKAEIPYTMVSDTAFYLNRTALMHAGLRSAVKNLPDAVERNIPPPFLVRHIREVSVAVLLVIVMVFAVFRIVYSRRYRHKLNLLFERYKTLYNEYEVVYENMPVGLMLFDVYGNLLKRNSEADIFFEKFAHSQSALFHLFDFEILDEEMQEALFNNELVSRLIHLSSCCYRMQCCIIADEETGDNHVLVIVIDNTEIEKERRAKEQISNVLNFAMNKAAIGVAEYNLMDGHGFATDAWYDTLALPSATSNLLQAHQCLVSDDREKLERYLEHVRYGASHLFLDNLEMRTPEGESHYLRYLIQPLEYAPDRKHIIVAEMVLPMDEQVTKQRELEAAMKRAQEADRFKNAFVANTKDEIRIPLEEIILCSQALAVSVGLDERNELNARIEAANNQILKLLNDIIDVSKVELNE